MRFRCTDFQLSALEEEAHLCSAQALPPPFLLKGLNIPLASCLALVKLTLPDWLDVRTMSLTLAKK